MAEKKSQNILGKVVVGQHGREVGTIDEVLVDTEAWQVVCLGVKLNRDTLEELKLKRPLWGTQSVRISCDEVSGLTDMIVLKHKLEDMAFTEGEAAPDALPPDPGDAAGQTGDESA